MIKKVVLGVLTVVTLGCSTTPEKTSDWTENQIKEKKELVKAVMAIHDEAMPWMDDIHKLKKQLGAKADTLSSDSTKQQMELMISELDAADEAMMAWMRQYREPKDTGSFEIAKQYLKNQEQSADKMRTKMKNAIEQAKSTVQ